MGEFACFADEKSFLMGYAVFRSLAFFKYGCGSSFDF